LATKKLFLPSRQRTVSYFISEQEIFDQKQHDCRPTHSNFYLFPGLKIKLKGRYFDTIVLMEAELQAVLNIRTEQGFQDAFEKQQALRMVHSRER
jgi:hypothetical protein